MPTITYDKQDLLSLIGRNLTDRQLEEAINLIKPEVEQMTKDEITVELTPDRPDLFGIEGLARAIRSYLEIETGVIKYTVAEPKVDVKVGWVPVRPYVGCAVVRSVTLTDALVKSLMNIQEVLHDTIGIKRKKVAIGVHDLDRIEPSISYIGMSNKTKMIPLGESTEMTLEEVLDKTQKGKGYGDIIKDARQWPVFIDKKGVFSFPPIINSDRTKVVPKTKNLFIEMTGTDKQALMQTLNILITNLGERKCRLEAVRVSYMEKQPLRLSFKHKITPNLDESTIEVDAEAVNGRLGLQLSNKEMVELLERMGFFAVASKNKRLRVIVPAYRADVLHAVDIVEDVAIAYGYNNLIPELPNVATVGRTHPVEKTCQKVRQVMVGLGFLELMRPTLTNLKDQFYMMNVEKEDAVEIENPVSQEYTSLRVWLIPSLIKVLSANKHMEYPQNIFEIGDVVLPDANEETMSRTVRRVAGVVCHSKASFSEIRSVVETLLKNMAVDYTLEESACRCFIPGRAADIIVNGKEVGQFGEIHPAVLDNFGIGMPVASFEITVEEL